MNWIIVANLCAILLMFLVLTIVVCFYFKEVKMFRQKESEMDKQIKYYIKELEKRSGEENVDLH